MKDPWYSDKGIQKRTPIQISIVKLERHCLFDESQRRIQAG